MLTPVAAARSVEKMLRVSSSLNRKIEKATNNTAAKPRRNPFSEILSNRPKRDSARSSPGVMAAPMAKAAAKITPMAASVARPVFL